MKIPFLRRPAAATKPQFSCSTEGSDVLISLTDGGSRHPVEHWASKRSDAAAAIAQVLGAAEDDKSDLDGRPMVELEGQSVRLRPAFVAGLDAGSAAMLGLPTATSLGLDLKPIGRIDQDDFHIETRWVEPGGRPMRARLDGALLTGPLGLRRVPEPLWSLHRAAMALSAPVEKAERFRALAELQALWPDDPKTVLSSNGYLDSLRVHYASSLSLKLRTLTPDRTDFDPVLFGGRSVSEAEAEGRTLDDELDNVLTPASQKLFAEDRFRREPHVRPVYVLRDGEYIFIDAALRPALDAVRKLQDRPEAERRAFVLNPVRVLREQLGDETADRIGLDHLFVETEQFSARVAGVDIWRAPVLPWLTPSAQNKWLPERFGLRIGDDYFVVPPENVSDLIRLVQEAAAAGHQTVNVGELLTPATEGGPEPPRELPVNDQVVSAVESFAPFSAAPGSELPGTSEAPGPVPALHNKIFLVVRENLQEVEFAPYGVDAEAHEPPPHVSPPKRLHSELKPHQLRGLNWLAACIEAGRPGALLADDMGLGKTLQAIALMAWLQEEAEAGRQAKSPFLIVAPTGLLGTWRDEINKHLDFPRLGPLVPAFGGDLKTLREEDTFGTKDIESGRAALRAEAWRAAGIVLTTYETMRDYHFSFARTRFGLVIFDEIQKLKNPASQLTRAARALNADFTLGMTGTPVENRLQDIWSIMDVIAPGLLGSSREFEKRHPADDLAALARLKSQLTDDRRGHPSFMLRRLKADALEGLPAKHVHRFESDMPTLQANAYRDLVVRAVASAAGGTIGKGGMLSTLAAMRGVSLHPLDPRQAPDDLSAYAADSARLSRALEVLDKIAAANEKALIFVEDLAMQERLAALVQTRFKLRTLPMRINGSVPGPKRQALVDAFQRDRGRFDVMILSPKAGGVGLTLTAANHVIHLSRWWNPAVEDQATDRVFRIGQTRDVHVYLPLAVHPDPLIRNSSFDLRLDSLIERKRKLTRDLFLPPDLADSELTDLFREVSLGGEESPDVAASADAPEGISPSPAQNAQEAPEPARPILSLPGGLANSGIRLWRRGPGEERPTDEILGLFANKHIVQVTIRDPYALGHRNARAAQARFLEGLAGVANSLEAASLEYCPDIEGDVPEPLARKDMNEMFLRVFSGSAPRFALVRRARSRDDDFHDRFVDVQVRHAGGVIRRHELTLGRGLEALYDRSKQCTVTYAPPS